MLLILFQSPLVVDVPLPPAGEVPHGLMVGCCLNLKGKVSDMSCEDQRILLSLGMLNLSTNGPEKGAKATLASLQSWIGKEEQRCR